MKPFSTAASRSGHRRISRRDALGRVGAGFGIVALFARDTAAQRSGARSNSPRTTVNSVLGPLETSRLGFTLSHEHIIASSAGIWQAWPELFGGRAKFIATASDQLKRAKDEGVSTIIDCTTIDLGRDIRMMEEVSRRSGLHVIASTGVWLDPSNTLRQRTVDELSDFFVREITVGIEGTDIKAGVIKVANGNTIDMFGDKLLRAAARASRMTGVPITTHTAGLQRMGEKQAVIFEEEGIAPQRICIGHSDNSPADYQMGLARRGYRIGMDQLPRGGAVAPGTPLVGPGALPWAQRYSQIKSLVDAGFADRVMLGNDDSLAMTIQPTASTAARVAMNPDGMLFVVRKAIPALKQLGISAEAIRTMTIDAPKKFFES